MSSERKHDNLTDQTRGNDGPITNNNDDNRRDCLIMIMTDG